MIGKHIKMREQPDFRMDNTELDDGKPNVVMVKPNFMEDKASFFVGTRALSAGMSESSRVLRLLCTAHAQQVSLWC